MDLSPLHLWQHLGWPLTRLFLFLGLGLMVALFPQSLNWTKKIAAQPLTRFAACHSWPRAPLPSAAFRHGGQHHVDQRIQQQNH